MHRYIIALLFIPIAGCLSPVTDLYPEEKELRPIEMYVISHGWHVGIAVQASAVEGKLPDHEQMPRAEYLKFGWGDNKYYPDSEAGFGLLLRAALLPTRSVIHVVGIDMPPDRYFPSSDIIKINISEKGADKFADFIADRFRLDDHGNAIYAADGLYTNSVFYNATGLYFIPKTSNTWTARALRQTGYPITPFYAVTSGNVIQQSRKDGEIIQLR